MIQEVAPRISIASPYCLRKVLRLKHLTTMLALSLVGLACTPAIAQSRSERVDKITSMLSGAMQTQNVSTRADDDAAQRATPRQLLRQMTAVDFDKMPARAALEIWSEQTNIPLVVNWASLKAEGVETNKPITLKLNRVPASVVLKLLVKQMHPNPFGDDEILMNTEDWYVQLITKREALRRSSTRLYFIGDLLMTVPNFTDAPGFGLNDALSNTNSGGSGGNSRGGGGGGGLFFADDTDIDRGPTKLERAENIMDMIRNTIEPDIWQANGGEFASVRYMRGMLVIKAPDFVHDQIGIPFSGSSTTGSPKQADRPHKTGSAGNSKKTKRPTRTGNGVAGVAPRSPKRVR